MRRKVISVLAWLVATVASILLATAAVGNVGSWGSDRPASQATASSLTTLVRATSTTVPEPVSSSAVDPTPAPSITTSTTISAAPESTATTSPPPPTQSPTTTEAPGPSTTSTSSTSTTTTPTSTTTTTTMAPDEEYFESRQLVGGWVQLRVDGANVYLEAAVAEPGFTIDVEHNGPETVEVEFKSESHDSKLHARVKDGKLDIKIEEDSEDD